MKRRIENVEDPSINTFSNRIHIIDEDTGEELKNVLYANEITGVVVRYKYPYDIDYTTDTLSTFEEKRNIRIDR